MQRFVNFSSGVGSWAAAKLVAEKHSTADLTLVFADVKMEDEDNYRFLTEAAANIDAPLVQIADGRTPWDVFFDERFLGNSRVDPCSKILKRELLDSWFREHVPDKANAVIYVGIGHWEGHRFLGKDGKLGLQARMAEKGWRYEAPLLDRPDLARYDLLSWLEREGLAPPRLYDLGFSHANCFAAETEFITKNGLRQLGDAVGEIVPVISAEGRWTPAEIKAFGVQPLLRLRLNQHGDTHDLFVTAAHRWWIYGEKTDREERTTRELQCGDPLVCIYSPSTSGPRGVFPKWLPTWRVESVEPSGRVEEVFCAVVPAGHAFVLKGDILTGNCGGFCVKAGQKQFLSLLRALPERYAFHENKEQELRAFLGKDVSIMRDRSSGGSRPLTMKEFRERLQAGEKVSLLSAGSGEGCACFSGEPEETSSEA